MARDHRTRPLARVAVCGATGTPHRRRSLVLTAVVSVQFGGALAATLVPEIGAGGSVTLRLLFAAAILWAFARPTLRGHSRTAWLTVLAFGLALGLMNLAFYSSLAHLPIGVAVTVEFLGPLALATALSRRWRDLAAVGAAAVGVVLISEALETPCPSWSGPGWDWRPPRAPAGRHTSSPADGRVASSGSSTDWPSPWSSRSS